MKKVRLIVFGALCAGLSANLLAQEVFTRPVSVVPTVEPANNERESSIESVILSSIVQELTQEGFIARTEESGPRPKGDYYITAIYEADGAAIGLEISASQRRQGSAIVTASWEGELGMTTDVEIQELIRNEILPEIPRSIEVTQSEVDDAASEGEEWALALIAETAANDLVPQPPPRYRPWRVDTGAHAVMLLGSDFVDYKTGIGVRVSAGYAFKIGQFEMMPGLVTGYQDLQYTGFDYFPPIAYSPIDAKAPGVSLDTDEERRENNFISNYVKKVNRKLEASAPGGDYIIPFAAEFKTAYLGFNKVQPYFRVAVGGAWYKRELDREISLHDSKDFQAKPFDKDKDGTMDKRIVDVVDPNLYERTGEIYPGFQEFRFLLQTGLGAEYQILPYLGAYADVSAQFLFGGNSDSILPKTIVHLTPGLGVTLRY